MRSAILTIALALHFPFVPPLLPSLICQNLPDRIVVFDPLGDTTVQEEGFRLLPGTRLYGEFARYSNGSGRDHRWNAKLGGYAEFVRWSSTWSVGLAGTMEVIMDPLNDIAFNPRAIFWEEGLLISARAPWDDNEAIQFGYMHRCKHDIDNTEPLLLRNELEQRTLIYSGPFIRFLNRPTRIIDGPMDIFLGSALRFDYFLHTLDDRWDPKYYTAQPNVEDLIGAINGTVRLEGRFGNDWLGVHAGADWMLSFSSPLAEGLKLTGSFPFVELGLDFYNPAGSTFTIFSRGEWQPDDGIRTKPHDATLFLIGVRTTSFGGMW